MATTLLSYSDGIKSSLLDNPMTQTQSGGYGWSFVGGELVAGAVSSNYTDGNCEIKFVTPIRRYKSSKMYVSIRTNTSNSQWRRVAVSFFKDLSSGSYASGWHTQAWFDFFFADYRNPSDTGVLCDQVASTMTYPIINPQTRIEIDISSVDPNQYFYLGFYKCNLGAHIQEITFNDEIRTPDTESNIYSNGGGATHIAKVTGQLSTLSSNLSDILIVSGGGGGGMIIGNTVYNGADAGGISGNSINSANQSTGYAFGQGENGSDSSGGGGGLYGGYKGGGSGSGYIGNSLLINKKMVGYNVPTSSEVSTKTETVEVYSNDHEDNKPKAGNGFAKIKFLRQNPCPPEYEQYIRKMNEVDDGRGFWWKNETGELPVWTNSNAETLREGAAGKPIDGMVWSNHSYYSCYFGNYHEWGHVNDQYNVPYWTDNCVFTSTNVLTLNIVLNNDNTYTGTISGANNFVNQVWQYKSSASSSWSNRRYLHILRKNNITAYVADGPSSNSNPPDMTRTGTLEYVLNQFAAYFRNIKVYVDGVCWADPTQ